MKRSGYTEVVYADDLNAFKAFQSKIDNAAINADLRSAQRELHTWGRANQVNFDAGKEGFAILSRWTGHAEGADFRILGIMFDNSLTMAAAIDEVVKDCKWKICSLLRCQRHFDIAGTVSLAKGRVLPYIEHRTSAIYHAADSLIERVDSIQRHFLDRLGITERDALFDYGLAPCGSAETLPSSGLFTARFWEAECAISMNFFITVELLLRLATGRNITINYVNMVTTSPATL